MNQKGFTLLELITVIAIIGLLANISFASAYVARRKAIDTKRVADLTTLRDALEWYYTDNGVYPNDMAAQGLPLGYDCGAGVQIANCKFYQCPGGSVPADDPWIPGLAPDYVAMLPSDPVPGCAERGYRYASNGYEYKLLAHFPEISNVPTHMHDTCDNGYIAGTHYHGGYWTSGAECWDM